MAEVIENSCIGLLKKLIETPSFSKEENKTADIIQSFLSANQINAKRALNNVWAVNKYFDPEKPSILLNSHHDTVKPNSSYIRDPFEPKVEDGRLYGLGSNDAGGCLVSLLATFMQFYEQEHLKYNLIFSATAEEEISGSNGISYLYPMLPSIDFAIVGEPTQMKMAIAEKGLMVINGCAHGKAGHAAHGNTTNAIYEALKDIEWISNYEFAKSSTFLGPVKMSVTQVTAGSQHNVIPDRCAFVIDVRTNEYYNNEEVFKIIEQHTHSQLKARSYRLNSSSIAVDHPAVLAGKQLGLELYGSPTLSDQALLTCPSIKIGPGISTNSHIADEFIEIKAIYKGIEIYTSLLNTIIK
ncbi:M20/M25/M40 family metallo-hydrolase [Fulvivirga sp. RKSG066]|nr:M20 family metallo-hydrolase [Fulvivirga aurantia]MTI22509.1 M20/M25/M40 family metallo-hydrolase [Fulvivirga aurantia]